jgi:hypothetical protein
VTDPESHGNGGQSPPGGQDEPPGRSPSGGCPPGGSDAGERQEVPSGIPPVDDPGASPESDIDALFAAIIADFALPVPSGSGSWPPSEDLADDEPRLPQTSNDDRVEHNPLPEASAPSAEETQDEEGYVPPTPPPLPRGDLVSRIAWGAVAGGPLFLLLAALTWQTLPSSLLLLALLSFIGGFVTLVARMPPEPPDDPDDGAVV